jgi:hypothetical protein
MRSPKRASDEEQTRLVDKMTGGGGLSGVDVSDDDDVNVRLLLTVGAMLVIAVESKTQQGGGIESIGRSDSSIESLPAAVNPPNPLLLMIRRRNWRKSLPHC